MHFNLSKLDTFDKRKAVDHMALDDMCKRSSKIKYRIVGYNKKKLPNEYEVVYDEVKSIIGIEEDQSPIYGTKHILNIKLGPRYPQPEAICYFQTPIWHPNIKFAGPTKGRVCYNSKDLPSDYKLDELVEFIGKMIQYKNYHAILGKEPFPEDVEAARWVTSYAEPNGLLEYRRGIAIDQSYLLDPIKGNEPPERPDIVFY